MVRLAGAHASDRCATWKMRRKRVFQPRVRRRRQPRGTAARSAHGGCVLQPNARRRPTTDPLPFTGERDTPQLTGEPAYEHWHRYAFARLLAHGKRVLDAACSE